MKIGLYFGTFNPVHNGHLAIAGYMARKTDLDEVWFIVSPQNPLKKNDELLNDKARLQLVKLAVKKHAKLKANSVEFELTKPSYTFNTLLFLEKKYPNKKFILIIGEDNLRNFHLWKNHQKILSNFEIYVYPRILANSERVQKLIRVKHRNIKKFSVPLLNISATEIRQKISTGKDVLELLPEPVYKAIQQKKYYIERKSF